MITNIIGAEDFLDLIFSLKPGEEKDFTFNNPKKPRQLTKFKHSVREKSGRIMEINSVKGKTNVYRVKMTT